MILTPKETPEITSDGKTRDARAGSGSRSGRPRPQPDRYTSAKDRYIAYLVERPWTVSPTTRRNPRFLGLLLQRIDFVDGLPTIATISNSPLMGRTIGRLNSKFALDYGLRLEHQRLASSFSLRSTCGIAWTPFPESAPCSAPDTGSFMTHPVGCLHLQPLPGANYPPIMP